MPELQFTPIPGLVAAEARPAIERRLAIPVGPLHRCAAIKAIPVEREYATQGWVASAFNGAFSIQRRTSREALLALATAIEWTFIDLTVADPSRLTAEDEQLRALLAKYLHAAPEDIPPVTPQEVALMRALPPEERKAHLDRQARLLEPPSEE